MEGETRFEKKFEDKDLDFGLVNTAYDEIKDMKSPLIPNASGGTLNGGIVLQ